MNKKLSLKIFSVLLPLILLLSLLLPALAAEGGESAKYDLAKAGSSHNKTATSADILEDILGVEISEAERSYLVYCGALSINYDDGITTAKIAAIFEDNILSVTAYPYSYTSVGGVNVTWVPKSARLGEESKSLTPEADAYKTSFEAVSPDSEITRVDVVYALDVRISEEDALTLLNKARSDIPLLEEEIEKKTDAYNTALGEYTAAKEKYLAFLEEEKKYASALEKYNEYLLNLRIYEDKLEAYNEYLADKKEYDAALELRKQYEKDIASYKEEYQLYINYLAEKKTYENSVKEYNAYIEKAEAFRAQLAVIEYATVPSVNMNRTALAAINSDLVTTVLFERDTLESNVVGAPPKVISLAGEATDMLRILLNDYFSLTTEQGRYAYYLQNYEAFRDNFVNLFISLDYLYTNPKVRAALYETERDEKYRILLAQLYLISRSLSDTPVKSVPKDMVDGSYNSDKYKQFVYTDKYTMDIKKYTVSEVLGTSELLSDTNSAAPINGSFPAPVDEPVEPTEVKMPTEPAYVAIPPEVVEVSDPGQAPAEIENPGQAPAEVENPGQAPTEYIPPKEYTDLIAEKDKLFERAAEFSGDYILTLEKTVSKKFIDPDEVNVKFYSENGDTLLYETVIDAGTAADYEGKVPEKAEDERAFYAFAGWKNIHGERVSLSSVSSDQILYPYFEETLKEYKITFFVKNDKYELSLPYGSLPTPPEGITEVEYEGAVMRVFSGFDKEISPVTGECTYTAVYESRFVAPSSQGGADISVGEDGLVLDYGIASDRTLDISLVIDGAKREGGLTVISRYITLCFNYMQLVELGEAGGAKLNINVVGSKEGYCNYTVTVLSSDGKAVAREIGFKLLDKTLPLEANDRMRLYFCDGEGNRRYTKFSSDGDMLSFNAVQGRTYTLAYEYTVNAAAGIGAFLTADKDVYSAGETVELKLDLPNDVRLVRLYYTDQQGNETELDSFRFHMPPSDISIIAEVDYIRYKITFVSDNVVISSLICQKGQMPTVPESPVKSSDGIRKYTFIGWSEEVSAANGDKVYYAVFEASKLEKAEQPDRGMTIYQKVIICAVILVGVLILIVLTVILIRVVRKSRKR